MVTDQVTKVDCLSNFKTNIHIDADLIAHIVSRMHVPSAHALMGIAPVLAVIFGTDNTNDITRELGTLSPKDSADLCSKIQSVVASEKYPLTETVWQFNDPSADIKVLTTALGLSTPNMEDREAAMYDFLNTLDMTRDTYPYIQIGAGTILESDVLEFSENGSTIQNTDSKKTARGPEAWIVPSLTVGSLILLKSKLNER